MKKGMVFSTVVYLTLTVMSLLVILEAFNKGFVTRLDVEGKEKACLTANQIAQQINSGLIHKGALRLCSTIDLEDIPQKKIDDKDKMREQAMQMISKKTAKAWEIWLEGRKENMFEANKQMPDVQKCFIQYTFNLKAGTPAFTAGDLEFYLVNTLYKIDDTSDRCAGTRGGFCKEVCDTDENQVEAQKDCPKDKSYCCLSKDICENKGGTCRQNGCSSGETQYTNNQWTCSKNSVCCVSTNNYLTYTDYINANGGTIRMPEGLVFSPATAPSKDAKKQNFAETYAIVFSARTTNWFAWEHETNINRILIAPLNKVKDDCLIQVETSAGAANG